MQQLTLFPESVPTLPVNYYPEFLNKEEADELYQHCQELQWKQNQIRMLGKTMPVPRLECIYGDEGCDYLYSKSVLLKPLPWTLALAQLRDRITAATGYSFRIVIGNQYRSGQDSIGWHNDSEASMGFNPAIASISLGSCRKFQIKPIGGKPTDFWLEHGSLLVMHPGCQSTHLHQVPKTNKVVSTRINLTFRPHIGGKYILPQSSSTECPDSTGYNAFLGHTVMPSSDNLSIYTKNTSKITSEITHNAPLASPPAPPTQESVCEKEELDLTTKEIELEEPSLEKPTPEEPTPQQPTSLSINSESSQQTDNPSRGSTIAGGSFEKSEQANKLQITCPYKTARNVKELIDAWLTDPTAMSDDCVPLLVRDSIKWNCWVLPWRNGERKLNNLYQNFNPIVVDFLAQELATKSKRSARQEIDYAIAVMNTWEKTKGGWTNLMQRYQQAVLQTEKQPLPKQHTALAQKANTTNSSLEDALAQDRMRRQQELSKPVPSNGYQHSPQMLELKAKLQAKANQPRVPSNTRPSSMNLREVEAQLKLALRA